MAVDKTELRAVVLAVLAEQKQQSANIAQEAATAVLVSFGLHEDDQKEIRADFQHLRKWRKSVEQAQGFTFKAIVTTLATGVLAVVWLGLKTSLGK